MRGTWAFLRCLACLAPGSRCEPPAIYFRVNDLSGDMLMLSNRGCHPVAVCSIVQTRFCVQTAPARRHKGVLLLRGPTPSRIDVETERGVSTPLPAKTGAVQTVFRPPTPLFGHSSLSATTTATLLTTFNGFARVLHPVPPELIISCSAILFSGLSDFFATEIRSQTLSSRRANGRAFDLLRYGASWSRVPSHESTRASKTPSGNLARPRRRT